MLDLQGLSVMTAFMRCQKKAVAKEANYVIWIKEKQPALLKDAHLYFLDRAEGCAKIQTKEEGRGWSGTRKYSLAAEMDWIKQRQGWRNLPLLGAVASMDSVGTGRNTDRYPPLHHFTDRY